MLFQLRLDLPRSDEGETVGRFRQSARLAQSARASRAAVRTLFAATPMLFGLVAGLGGCGQLLGLDEDRSRIEGDPDAGIELCGCDDDNPCTRDTCAPGGGCEHEAVQFGAAPEQVAGDCQRIVCDAGEPVIVIAEDDFPEPEACLSWSCDGATPYSTPVTRGDACDVGGQFCDGAGSCVECIDDADCGGGMNTCGGAGTPGFCGCTPLSCEAVGLSCGATADGCGGTLSCDNGVSDGLETDVDCGGQAATCGNRCAQGYACLEANDCKSGFCGGGFCVDAWGTTLNSAQTATAEAVATNAGGQAAVVGNFVQSASFSGAALTTASSAGFLAVVEPAGSLAFARVLADGTHAADVAIDSAGNILVVGSRGGAPHIEKRDAMGNPLWTLAIGGMGAAKAVAVDSRGHSFVVGEVDGSVTFENETVLGSADTFLVEIDTAGDVVGATAFPSVGPQRAVDVAVGVGRVAVVADFAGTVDLGSTMLGGTVFDSSGDWDAYVVTVDKNRVPRAAVSLRGASEQAVAGVTYDGEGRLFVGGTFQSEIAIASTLRESAGDQDIFVARLDAGTLVPMWLEAYGDAAPQTLAAVSADVRGGVAIAGAFAGELTIDGSTLASAGSTDAFFATITETGVVRRTRRFGDADTQQAADVAMSAYGAVFVAGAFRGTVDFGQGPISAVGAEDAYVAAF